MPAAERAEWHYILERDRVCDVVSVHVRVAGGLWLGSLHTARHVPVRAAIQWFRDA